MVGDGHHWSMHRRCNQPSRSLSRRFHHRAAPSQHPGHTGSLPLSRVCACGKPAGPSHGTVSRWTVIRAIFDQVAQHDRPDCGMVEKGTTGYLPPYHPVSNQHHNSRFACPWEQPEGKNPPGSWSGGAMTRTKPWGLIFAWRARISVCHNEVSNRNQCSYHACW